MKEKLMKENYVQTCLSKNDKSSGDKYYSFKSECGCYSHDIHVSLEKIVKTNFIEMTISDKVYIGEYITNKNWFNKFLFRLKCAYKCLFKDGFEVEHDFVFKNEEHLKQFQQYFNERANNIQKKDFIKNEKSKGFRKPYRKSYKKSETKGSK
jgi:hypothetical protein